MFHQTHHRKDQTMMRKWTADPATHRMYEWTPISEVHPGDVVTPGDGVPPYIVTVARATVDPTTGDVGAIILFREPTNAEYEDHFARTGDDLRASRTCTSVPWYPILRAVPPQDGHLSH